ncbi:MAG: ChaN family lipoprotein, partial [Vicinamibacterales bacterium]
LVSGYVPERVFDTRAGAFSDFELMLTDLARADVVLVGEQHDDPNTHRLEAALLEGLLRRRVAVVVSLEMFERDVQPALDGYLGGRTSEEEFLKASRPWPRYATDYRSLIELAKGQSWPVVAANVPRRHASEIAKTGLGPLAALTANERAFVAADLQCPKDAYFDRFAASMSEHPAGSGAGAPDPAAQRAIVERYYQSQCAKDETMAESIATSFARRGAAPGPIVHVTGAFHSDFGTGTVERVRRRLPGRRVAIVTMVPLATLDGVTPSAADLTRADYLVYTVK